MSSPALPPLRLSILVTGGFDEHPASSVDIDHALDQMEREEAFNLVVHPVDEFVQSPRMRIDWHRGYGFVVMAFEDDQSIGLYPIVGGASGKPEVPIELGGQALEKWPRELFVPRETAARTLRTFIDSGRLDPTVVWVANDAFEPEIIWEI